MEGQNVKKTTTHNSKLKTHLTILCCLSGPQCLQSSPDVLSSSHIFHLLLWDCEAFPGQMGYVVPPAFCGHAFHLANFVPCVSSSRLCSSQHIWKRERWGGDARMETAITRDVQHLNCRMCRNNWAGKKTLFPSVFSGNAQMFCLCLIHSAVVLQFHA